MVDDVPVDNISCGRARHCRGGYPPIRSSLATSTIALPRATPVSRSARGECRTASVLRCRRLIMFTQHRSAPVELDQLGAPTTWRRSGRAGPSGRPSMKPFLTGSRTSPKRPIFARHARLVDGRLGARTRSTRRSSMVRRDVMARSAGHDDFRTAEDFEFGIASSQRLQARLANGVVGVGVPTEAGASSDRRRPARLVCYVNDDASTDATAEIALRFSRRDDRFVLRHGRNIDPSARNTGIWSR